jgi:ferric-dicitrate binding protein FerR (iron transport regulator)
MQITAELAHSTLEEARERTREAAEEGRKRYGRRVERRLEKAAKKLPVDTPIDRRRRRRVARRTSGGTLVTLAVLGGVVVAYVLWQRRKEHNGARDTAPDAFGTAVENAGDGRATSSPYSNVG